MGLILVEEFIQTIFFKTELSHPVDPLAGGDRAADPDHAVGQERGG